VDTDKQLFEETAKKRRLNPAQLAREIIHQRSAAQRRAPGTREEIREGALIDLQRETKAAVEALRKDVSGLQEFSIEGLTALSSLVEILQQGSSHSSD